MFNKLYDFCRRYIALALCCIGWCSCSKKLSSPVENPLTATMPGVPMSTIVLPMYIPMSELNRLVDSVIQQEMSEGFTLEDGYRLTAKIERGIQVSASERTLNFLIPVNLEIFPKSNWNNIRANGMIELNLDLIVDIFQNKFLCKSQLRAHRWITPPKLNVLGIKIPVEGMANRFIERYKYELTQSLDKYFNEAVDLEQLKKILRKSFATPFYSTEDGIINVYSSPSEFALGPMRVEGDQIVFPLEVYIENVISSQKPVELNNDMSFSIRPGIEEASRFAVQGRIPVNYMELMVKENFEHQQFGSGVSKIKVEKILMRGEGRTMEVTMQTSGAYKGMINIQFDPVFDEVRESFVLEHFRMKAIEGRSLDKTMFGLIRGFVENKVKSGIEEGINNIIREYRLSVEPYLQNKEIYPGVILQGALKTWTIRDLVFYQQNMVFNLLTDLQASLRILRIDASILRPASGQ
ncbi:MAG: DUF4403 family protein [Saprospiraceae bacterium]|mgnify:CR=1 FL=1